MNSITLAGRAGRDPEVRYFESGSMVANLTLAVNRRRDEDPDWFNLEIWGKTAQVAADYVRKGSLIGVVGRMNTEKWTDRGTGEERSKWVVRVDHLELLGPRPDSPGDALEARPSVQAQAPSARSRSARPVAQAVAPYPDEEDVPF